jgi:hypothetical protein
MLATLMPCVSCWGAFSVFWAWTSDSAGTSIMQAEVMTTRFMDERNLMLVLSLSPHRLPTTVNRCNHLLGNDQGSTNEIAVNFDPAARTAEIH